MHLPAGVLQAGSMLRAPSFQKGRTLWAWMQKMRKMVFQQVHLTSAQ
jgi:hypothetical protein